MMDLVTPMDYLPSSHLLSMPFLFVVNLRYDINQPGLTLYNPVHSHIYSLALEINWKVTMDLAVSTCPMASLHPVQDG